MATLDKRIRERGERRCHAEALPVALQACVCIAAQSAALAHRDSRRARDGGKAGHHAESEVQRGTCTRLSSGASRAVIYPPKGYSNPARVLLEVPNALRTSDEAIQCRRSRSLKMGSTPFVWEELRLGYRGRRSRQGARV